MQKLTFTLELTPVELSGMAATLLGMAAQIERNIGKGKPVVTTDMPAEREFLGTFPFDINGAYMDVFSNTPLLFEQINALPAEAFEKYEGETIEKTASDAFGNDDEKKPGDSASADLANGVTDVNLDGDGIPWDVRIHGASKAKLARGNTWKLKRGVDKTLVTTVIAELKAAMSAPASAEDTHSGLETTETVKRRTTESASNVTDINAAKPAGPAGPAPHIHPAGPTVEVRYVTNDGEWTREQLKAAMYTDEAIDAFPIVGQTVTTFPELMQLITPALAANTITDDQITAACVKNGLASIALIAARPDLVNAVKTELFG